MGIEIQGKKEKRKIKTQPAAEKKPLATLNRSWHVWILRHFPKMAEKKT